MCYFNVKSQKYCSQKYINILNRQTYPLEKYKIVNVFTNFVEEC